MNPLLDALEASRRFPPQISPNFLVEIDGAPEVFNYAVREVTVGGGTLEVEEVQSGALRFALPRNADVSRIEMTVEMDENGEIFQYFRQWREQVLSRDGYFGIPYGSDGYVRQVKISTLDRSLRPKNLIRQIQAFPETLGSVNFSVKQAEIMEMQITLVQFMPSTGLL